MASCASPVWEVFWSTYLELNISFGKASICWLIFSSVLECPKGRNSTSRHSAKWALLENAGSRFPPRGSIDWCSRTGWSVCSDYIVSCIACSFWLTGLKALCTVLKLRRCTLWFLYVHYYQVNFIICVLSNTLIQRNNYFGIRNCPSIWNTQDYWIKWNIVIIWEARELKIRFVQGSWK